jgi:hypothetical protein
MPVLPCPRIAGFQLSTEADFLEQSFVLLAGVGVERAGFFPAGRVPKLFDREEFLALETLPQELERGALGGVVGHLKPARISPPDE